MRACHPGGVYTIDWSNNQDAVIITGTAIFEGDMLMKGIGWIPDEHLLVEGQVVCALHPAGIGTVEYEVGLIPVLRVLMLGSRWQELWCGLLWCVESAAQQCRFLSFCTRA